MGLLEQVRQRTYRITPSGMAVTSEGAGADPGTRGTAERALADAVTSILSHPVFRDWIQDSATPKHFRDAGYFWGIAIGTPPSVIRTRITDVERTLQKAVAILDSKKLDEITGKGGKVLFDRKDLERAAQFNRSLTERFAKDLSILQVDLSV